MSLVHIECTFLNDTPFVIQHTLHLTASHVRQARLIHEGLPSVKTCAVEQHGPHSDQKANVVLPQTCRERGCIERVTVIEKKGKEFYSYREQNEAGKCER